ncbi:hypothetical protein HDV57DRAFT_496107 [Trichoderma longibrachiatum]|uniref:Heterokaryon incompatibility domain-containing protein n=1 Tax=Trichoderma longibrachiatum ATCC 18648 TaxID=983965 RepID=A0A2T4C0V6_TRILO|nr:hypothetical protein M440DRAFT_1402710 [Trichoderma longibrachiatum ATCC 18648]
MADHFETEDASKRVLVAKKMLKTMGFHEEMLRSIVTSWLVPQLRAQITSDPPKSLTRIQDVGFLAKSRSDGLRPYRMFDITDRMLVDEIDPTAPYCMVSHRCKEPEVDLELLRKARDDVAQSYPVWYTPERTDVEVILKHCKENVKQQRKNVNGCAVKNRLDEKLAEQGCYVASLLKMHHQSKKADAEIKEAKADLEKVLRDRKVSEMERKAYRDLNKKAKSSVAGHTTSTSLPEANSYEFVRSNKDEHNNLVKAAHERLFDAEWERERESEELKFDALSRDLRESVEAMIHCIRLWRSAIKIEQLILKAGEIFDGGLMAGQKQQKCYLWLDTCCIDKSNHNEHSETMSLMGDWYAQSSFTLVHLDTGIDKSPKGSDAEIYWNDYLQTDGDHHKLESLPDRELDDVQHYRDIGRKSEVEWSTRGWTLQELVMSRMTYFVNADWKLLPRPVESLGRLYHLIPYIDLYTEALDGKPSQNTWRPEVLMTALLNSGAVAPSDATKVVYPRIQRESDEAEVEVEDDTQSLSNRLLTSIAMPWNIVDTMFHVIKPEPAKAEKKEEQDLRADLLREMSVLWDPSLASRFPQAATTEEKKEKQKLFQVPEHPFPQSGADAEDRVLRALSLIKALELVGFCFPKDFSRETARSEMAQAVYFAAVGLIECYDETRYPIVVQKKRREESNNKPTDAEVKAMLKLKRKAEKRVKLEMRKKLFQELLNSFPDVKKRYPVDGFESIEEEEEAFSNILAHILHVLVVEVKPLLRKDRQFIAEFANITSLHAWVDGTKRCGFTTQEVMALACERRTTKPFDRAYSLMGILGVRFPTFSAEGYEKALCRLLDETITIHNDVSVFNWTGHDKGSPIRGRSMYPLTQEAYKAEAGRLHNRNPIADVERDKMSRTTNSYYAIVALLRDTIDFLKKNTPPKQEVEWIQAIATIVQHLKLQNLRTPSGGQSTADKGGSQASSKSRKGALPLEIEIISKFIGYIINPSRRPAYNLSDESLEGTIRVALEPEPEPVPVRAATTLDCIDEQQEPVSPITDHEIVPSDDVSAVAPTETPSPDEAIDEPSPPLGRKSRFVEQLSEAGPVPTESTADSQDRSQTEVTNPHENITRYLQNWAMASTQGVNVDEEILKDQLPPQVRGVQYKIEESQEENSSAGDFGAAHSNMVSPHPIMVTSAGIEGIFDVQRVIITMADMEGLRQQVEHTTSGEQILTGYCSISTGFAQVIVQFSCKSSLLRQQLEVIDGIDLTATKEEIKKVEKKKKEHKITPKGLWDKMKRDKKNKKKKGKDEDYNDLESEMLESTTLDDAGDNAEAEKEAPENQQSWDLDEKRTVSGMIKFIQEDDLRLVAGEWVLARCSGVPNANWFLCHLELGSTHPFYGYRIPTSEINFDDCTPEGGLVVAWNTYMNRKKEEMCKIMTMLLKSKERKLKRRKLVGRILRDLKTVEEGEEEEEEYDPQESRESLIDRTESNDGPVDHGQNEYDYLDEYPQERSEMPQTMPPNSAFHSQDSALSIVQDDMWSAPFDPQSQFTASSYETPDMLPNQELRPEDSVSNIGDQDSRPTSRPPTARSSTVRSSTVSATTARDGGDDDEKSHFWDILPFIEKVAETKAKHFDKHLSATVLKDTPPVLRQAIENLNERRDFLPTMFHSAKKIHMF